MFERLLFHSLVTLQEMSIGVGLSFLLAMPLSYAMFVWTGVRRGLEPLCLLMQGIPMFALAPMMVFLFGWSQVAIITPMVLMLVFPLSINFLKGMEATPKRFVEFYQLHGLSKLGMLRHLRIPFALPHIFAGLRVAASVAVSGAIAGEWAGGQAGLGVYMQMCRRDFEFVGLLGAFGCIVSLSLLFYYGTKFLEKRCAIYSS